MRKTVCQDRQRLEWEDVKRLESVVFAKTLRAKVFPKHLGTPGTKARHDGAHLGGGGRKSQVQILDYTEKSKQPGPHDTISKNTRAGKMDQSVEGACPQALNLSLIPNACG